jgi:hypothetical protein
MSVFLGITFLEYFVTKVNVHFLYQRKTSFLCPYPVDTIHPFREKKIRTQCSDFFSTKQLFPHRNKDNKEKRLFYFGLRVLLPIQIQLLLIGNLKTPKIYLHNTHRFCDNLSVSVVTRRLRTNCQKNFFALSVSPLSFL